MNILLFFESIIQPLSFGSHKIKIRGRVLGLAKRAEHDDLDYLIFLLFYSYSPLCKDNFNLRAKLRFFFKYFSFLIYF